MRAGGRTEAKLAALAKVRAAVRLAGLADQGKLLRVPLVFIALPPRHRESEDSRAPRGILEAAGLLSLGEDRQRQPEVATVGEVQAIEAEGASTSAEVEPGAARLGQLARRRLVRDPARRADGDEVELRRQAKGATLGQCAGAGGPHE